jgi:hypothetical protein
MLYVQESYINATKGYCYGDSPVYETFTDDRGVLYREMQREYGRCTSKVYIDDPEIGAPKAIGWVFQKRVPYADDPNETYLREVWVTVHTEGKNF